MKVTLHMQQFLLLFLLPYCKYAADTEYFNYTTQSPTIQVKGFLLGTTMEAFDFKHQS